jgi:8-oxo-dGTP diphosphatase
VPIGHELREESGYDLDQLELLQPPIQRLTRLTIGEAHPYPVSHNTHPVGSLESHFHTDSVYAFVTSQRPHYLLPNRESSDIQAFTREELAQLPSSEIFGNVRELGAFVLDVCVPDWDRVPATN